MKNNSYSSDFISESIPTIEEKEFAKLQEFYTSPSGFNKLYRAERYGKQHILKTLQQQYKNQPFYQQVLQKEFNIGYQIEHPNICRTLGWENVKGIGLCIVLEYIDGNTLKEVLEQGNMSFTLAKKIIIELCEALHYLHQKQVVHRDLKPSNILITHNGNNAKIIDFGLSDQDDYEVLKLPAGTRHYLAPEVLQFNGKLDSRSDIYSLGIIIGEIATAVKSKHLAAISRKCTQHNPQKRYASTHDIILELHKKRNTFSSKRLIMYTCLCLLLSIGVYIYNLMSHTESSQIYPVFGNNTALNKHCSQILSEKRYNLNKKDSSAHNREQLIILMKTILDEEFPLPIQKQSLAYRLQWEAIEKEISSFNRTD